MRIAGEKAMAKYTGWKGYFQKMSSVCCLRSKMNNMSDCEVDYNYIHSKILYVYFVPVENHQS